MRFLLIPLVLLAMTSCSSEKNNYRGYVISKAHVGGEAEEEPPCAQSD